MGAPPAICSPIEDALRPLGVKVDAMPVTPSRLHALIRKLHSLEVNTCRAEASGWRFRCGERAALVPDR